MSSDHSNARVIFAALAGNAVIALAKFVAAFFSGSLATLAEAIHSVADTANQALLLIGLRRSEKPPTLLHPFGHAVESYFWPFMVSILIFMLGGVFAFYEGITHLYAMTHHAPEGAHHNPLGSYIVLGTSIVLEGASFRVAFGEFKKMRGDRTLWETLLHAKDPTIPVVLAEDTAALFGLVIAFVSVAASQLSGWSGFDAIGSLLIGVVLAAVAYFLAKRTHSLLLGEAATEEDRLRIHEIARKVDGVVEIRQLLSMHLGPTSVVLALKVQFDVRLSVDALERTIDALEAAIREAMPHMRYIFVEPDGMYQHKLDLTRPSTLPEPDETTSASVD